MQRYFAKEKQDNYFLLDQGDTHHIKTVMRMKDNSNIEVVYNNELYLVLIESLENKLFKLVNKMPSKETLTKEVCLMIPILKEAKMDYILQKSTELGVTKIVPVAMQRCVVKLDESKFLKKRVRWDKIVKEASEQSKRTSIPIIDNMVSIESIDISGYKLMASTIENKQTIKKRLKNIDKYDKMVFIVGPEGGFSPKEEQTLIDKGFLPVTLGNLILRVETAPLFLLSVLNYESME
jgi:16S rRNA (uracil1498-N3)-methyltransferase